MSIISAARYEQLMIQILKIMNIYFKKINKFFKSAYLLDIIASHNSLRNLVTFFTYPVHVIVLKQGIPRTRFKIVLKIRFYYIYIYQFKHYMLAMYIILHYIEFLDKLYFS